MQNWILLILRRLDSTGVFRTHMKLSISRRSGQHYHDMHPFDIFRKDYYHNYVELAKFLESNPLLEYSARYWGHHARGDAEKIIHDMVVKFLENRPNFPCVCQVMLVNLNQEYSQDLPKRFSINAYIFIFCRQTT